MPTWITLAQAARRFGLSRTTLYRLIASGTVARVKRTGDPKIYLSAEDVERATQLTPKTPRPRLGLPWIHAKVSEAEWLMAFRRSQDVERRALDAWRRLWQKGTAYRRTHGDLVDAADRALVDASHQMLSIWDGDREAILQMLERRSQGRQKR